MQLEDKHSYSLPVKDLVEEGRNQYYIVENDGVEYKLKLYDFQKCEPRPAELRCLARAPQGDDSEIYLVQDYSSFLNRFYEIGHVYPFRVVSIHLNQPLPYYQVRDLQGLTFRLVHNGLPYLEIGDSIKCRVEAMQGYKMKLKLVTGGDQPQLKFFTIRQLSQAVNAPSFGRLFARRITTDPDWAEINQAYEARQGDWVMRALAKLQPMLDMSQHSRRHFDRLLKTITDVCLYLLEGSDFLRTLYDDDRAKYQHRLEEYVDAYRTQIEALKLLHSRRDEDFVNSVLNKMRHSGYLYNPRENLDLLMALFALRPETVDEKMTDILDIITEGNRTNWMLEPFRSAFMRQLEYYVRLAKERTDRASYEDPEGRTQISKMMSVLALQQLMAKTSDQTDLSVNRSSLYRYLTFRNSFLSPQLLEKAFLAVTDNLNERPDFKWENIGDLDSIALQLSNSANSRLTRQSSQTFDGASASLRITGRNISIAPQSTANPRPALPAGLLPWHDLQVYTDTRITPIAADVTDYRRLARFWHEIEQSLFEHTVKPEPTPRLRRPGIGDQVDIVVDEVSEDGLSFQCHVSEENLTGEGSLTRSEIVPYNIEGLTLANFRNREGAPYRLRAEVVAESPDGSYVFSMRNPMKHYTTETCGPDTEFSCLILKRIERYYDETRQPNFIPGYVGITSDGDSVMCIFDGQPDPCLSKWDTINGVFERVSSKGQIICQFESMAPGETITFPSAFNNLLENYNDFYGSGVEEDNDDDDDDQDVPQASQLDLENVRELIRIIDRVATLEEDRVRMFNYLAFCHLLARLIGDQKTAGYYKRRMSFLDTLKTFLDSGTIDLDHLDLDNDGYMDYPRLQREILQLRVLSYFDQPEHNEELWRLATNPDNSDSVRQLARLALTSNMSLEFKFTDHMREQVNQEVSRLLNIPLRLPTLISFGREESQTLEFKSSYICPPDTLHPDPERQRQHIMQRIAGFINSEQGGTMYIGVNNYGTPSGLETDMAYFGSRDKFDLRVRNDILNALGPRGNGLVDSSWCDDRFPSNRRKDVYRLDIRPCPDGIKIAEKYWVRQGTSTYQFTHSEFNKILSDRRQGITGKHYEQTLQDEPETTSDTTLPTPEETDNPKPQKTVVVDNSISISDAQIKFTEGFSTGLLRPNHTHDWEDGFVVPRFYLHFLGDDSYQLSTEENYETERTLAVQESEADSTLVCVYADGSIMTVPISELDEKERDKRYIRYRDVPLAFASVGRPDDKLLLVYRVGNLRYARIENVSDLRLGSLTDTPQQATTADFDEVVGCELMPAGRARSVRTLLNISSSTLGKPIEQQPVSSFIDSLGIRID